MKQQVKQEDKKEFGKLSAVFTVLLLAMMITPIPLAHFSGLWGLAYGYCCWQQGCMSQF